MSLFTIARTTMEAGDKALDFCLSDDEGNETCLRQFRGKWVVLYFYPKDNTPGCTLEAIDFSKEIAVFNEMDCEVIGISPDSKESHCGFRDKHGLKIRLLSDPDHSILEKYDVWRRKRLYGRLFFGVERSTFLINPGGQIVHVWRKVKVPGHMGAVKEKLIISRQEFGHN